MTTSDDSADGRFDALLEYLRRTRGFNFAGYKRASLMRRIIRRMQQVAIDDYGDYLDYLEVHPDEFGQLFDAILINVTEFFRDPLAWDSLRAEAIPHIIADKVPGDSIRVWSAGCATGAEAYSLAIVLAEALGIEQFRERVKIYATDIDEGTLAKARLACYEARDVQGVPPELLEKYFTLAANRYTFHKELRRAVIFGRHDLMQDAPISRIDLLVCRNTLMYFNSDAQARILERLHFALTEQGYLFLGKAETLLSYHHIFMAVDIKRRIFAKVARGALRQRSNFVSRAAAAMSAERPPAHPRVREQAFEQSPFPLLVVDAGGTLAAVNASARQLFGLSAGDIGRPIQDLQVSYRPVDLRSCIDRANAERRPTVLTAVEWPDTGAEPKSFDVHVMPLVDNGDTVVGVTIAFTDVSEARKMKDDLQRSTQELETAQEELQSANEELQSANEELETTNEELQSTNEELEAVNEELRQRSDELNEVNVFLESVLASLNSGIVVLDRKYVIRAWNECAEDLWGLRADEVCGKALPELDIGLPVRELRQPVEACLDGGAGKQELTLDARNRRGRPIRCKVTCTPMRDSNGIRGAVLVMEASDGHEKPSTAA